jgi:predicted Zn-dependent peptidase
MHSTHLSPQAGLHSRAELLHSYECSAGTFSRYKLANGAMLQVLNNPKCEYGIHGQIDFHAGYGFEAPNFKEGTAHFFEHLIGANMGLSDGQVVDMRGYCARNRVAFENMQTGPYSVFITLYTLDESNLEGLLNSLVQTALKKIDGTILEMERGRIRQERSFIQKTPELRTTETISDKLYPTFKRASGPLGSLQNIDSLSLPELQDYQSRHFRLDNSVITLVGRLPDNFFEVVEGYMSEIALPSSPLDENILKARQQKLQNKWEVGLGSKETLILPEPGILTLRAMLCFPATGDVNSEEHAHLYMLAQLLSGNKQLSLNTSSLSQSGICYQESCARGNSPNSNHFEISFDTDASEFAPLSAGLALVKSNLVRLQNGDFDSSLIAKILDEVMLKSSLYVKDTVSQRIHIAEAGVHGSIPENRDSLVGNLMTTSKANLVAAACKYLNWDNRLLVISGNPEKLEGLDLNGF